MILGIADRMLTSGDVEFEPATSKIYAFSLQQDQPTKIVCLSADDTDLGYMVAQRTHVAMLQEKRDFAVHDAAYLYAQNFAKLRRERAETLHLAPLGLDMTSFQQQQRQLDPRLVKELADKLNNEELRVEALVIGMDRSGPHIYHVYDPGQAVCRDRSAFWAIGFGSRHFETLCMSLSYDCNWSVADAMLLMYSAKKKAEAAPGVGRATDVFMITQDDGMKNAPPGATAAFEEHYQTFEKEVAKNRRLTVMNMAVDARIYGREKPDQPPPPSLPL